MRKLVAPLVFVGCLAACGGAAVVKGGAGSGDDTDPNPPIDSDGTLPPGTVSPTPATGIVRYEPKDDKGSGYATGFKYDSANDTFSVDNLAFDGANTPYTRGKQVGSLGQRFAVYEGPDSYPDDVTDVPIRQFQHRAIYGVSQSGQVELAIVRTGAYVNYGFGGFIYQRNGGVDLPTTGMAHYSGEYAGLRDFNGRAGLEYVNGDMTMDIDFEDFNKGNGVRGSVTNRRVYDMDGNDITADITAALGTNASVLPTISLNVGPGVMTGNGEMTGHAASYNTDENQAITPFEEGNYYAIVSGGGTSESGDGASEVVGIIVIEATDPRGDYTTRETGGFLLTRP